MLIEKADGCVRCVPTALRVCNDGAERLQPKVIVQLFEHVCLQRGGLLLERYVGEH